jgi:phosphoribosylformylglycinamidine cyclo-ligase
VDLAEQVIEGIAAGCRQAGCALIGGETAEHPGDFPAGEYDLAGFAVGVIEKNRMLNPQTITPGDFLIGLPSSGVHSNGFSLVRKALLENGKMKLRAAVPDLGQSLGEALLTPMRIYADVVRALFPSGAVKGIAHITGGGIPGNLPRVLPPGRRAWVDRRSWKVPAIFDLIRRVGRISPEEMDRTFNNGLGMILVADKKKIDGVTATLNRLREPHRVVGEIKSGSRGVSFVT